MVSRYSASAVREAFTPTKQLRGVHPAVLLGAYNPDRSHSLPMRESACLMRLPTISTQYFPLRISIPHHLLLLSY
jgi:hypothetical protein